MRIEQLAAGVANGRARVSARVVWEDAARPPQELYYEVEAAHAGDLVCNPNAFVAACAAPAMLNHERRIRIDAPVCPLLLDRLQTVFAWFALWYAPAYQPPALEAPAAAENPRATRPRRTGLFFSGGLDAMFTLWNNRQRIPRGYPGSIDDCIFVHGVDIQYDPDDEPRLEFFRRAQASLEAVTQEVGATLVPLYTNVRHLQRGLNEWVYWTMSGGMASIGHALAERLCGAHLSSALEVPRMLRHGSHPLIDPNYSSADFQMMHTGERHTRLDKARALAGWPAGLRHLRVCAVSDGTMNCGRCEKCIRTMLALAASGTPHVFEAFGLADLSPELVRSLKIRRLDKLMYHEPLIGPLRAAGRHDLAEAVDAVVAEARRSAAWDAGAGWKGRLRQWDARYLRGSLQGVSRALAVPGTRRSSGAGRPA